MIVLSQLEEGISSLSLMLMTKNDENEKKGEK